jgi:hypothetical protein
MAGSSDLLDGEPNTVESPSASGRHLFSPTISLHPQGPQDCDGLHGLTQSAGSAMTLAMTARKRSRAICICGIITG